MTLSNQDQVTEFLELGYFVTPVAAIQPVPQELLAAYNELIMEAEVLGARGLVKTRKSERADTVGRGWSWGCDHIHAPELRRQALLDLVSLAPIPYLVKEILGTRVRFCGAHGHWSPETYDYYLHWHRDTRRERWRFANPDRRAHVQVCIALTDESVVWVVPASHTRDLSPSEEILINSDPHSPHPDQHVVSVPAGHALFLNTYTLHRAQCSRHTMRRSLHFGFARVAAKPEPGRRIKAWPWLDDPQFLTKQTAFLREAILEESQEAVSLGITNESL